MTENILKLNLAGKICMLYHMASLVPLYTSTPTESAVSRCGLFHTSTAVAAGGNKQASLCMHVLSLDGDIS